LTCLSVPDQILIAFIAELKLYGFRPAERPFPEFLRILEKRSAAKRECSIGRSR
jgi:hypothetical protein